MRFSMYTLYFILISGVFGAFLQDQLPLQVLSITPNELTKVGQTNRQAVLLRGIDPITVVFTRPVIALGSDFQALNRSVQGGLGGAQNPFTLVDLQGNLLNVSGKLRWPTTYIARFDPDKTWPTDLEFVLNLNPNLQSYDGVNLAISDAAPAFQTNFLSGSFTSVDSQLAQNVTGGAWSPTVGSETEPEAPPDAEIRYEFSNPVNLDMIRRSFALSIKQGALGDAAVTFSACPPRPSGPVILDFGALRQQQSQDLSSCVLIRPRNLAQHGSYMLTLPAGVMYHENAGLTHRPLTFIFHGLYPFTFSPVSFNQWFQPRYRRLDFYLRHGLAANTDLSTFQRALTISTGLTTLPFNVSRPDNVTLRILGEFQPNTQYRFGFSNARIEDGFQQMFRGLNFSFTTAPTNALFSEPTNNNEYTVFATGNAPSNWKLMTRAGTGPQQQQMTLGLGAVNPTNFANSLSARGYQASRFATTIQSQPATSDFRIQNLSLPSNFFLRQREYVNFDGRTRSYQGAFTSITDLGVSVISAGSTVDVWVTNMTSGANVPAAQVVVYTQQSWNSNSPAVLVGQGTTGPDGTARVTISPNENGGGQYLMYVSKAVNGRQDQTFVEYYPSSIQESTVSASIVMDRGVYKPGDTINLKVFATQRDGTTLKPFTEAGSSMSIQWDEPKPPSWQPVQQTFPIQWDPTYGTWFTSIEIPANVTFGPKTVSVVKSDQQWITSATILVSDPRRPTASLELSVDPTWVLGDNLVLNATVLTGTNQPIANANIQVQWTSESFRILPNSDTQPVNSNGSFVLTTGADGTVSKQDFTLNGVRAGETYTFEATYVGPTGEVLQQTTQATTATSKWSISLAPDSKFGALTNLPGFEFGWVVTVRNENGAEVRASGSIDLYPVNSDRSARASCQFTTQVGQTQPVCTGFSLPAIGAYVAVATTRDNNQRIVSANYSLGRSEADWKINPLDKYFLQDFGFSLDKTSYAVGETARVKFDNPFTGATMWLSGNGISAQAPVTVGANEATFVVPQACYGGCSISIVVAVPAQPNTFASRVRASGVPISVWTDLRAPRSFQNTLSLNVPDVNRQINVNIVPPARSAPGTAVTFSVRLTDRNNAPVTGEVAIFVVDRAFIQVSPYPLVRINDSFVISSSEYRSSFDNRQNLISWRGAEASLATFANRLAQDPWIDYSENQADQSDEEFFRLLSTRVTEWGRGGSIGQLRGGRGGAMMYSAMSAPVSVAMPMMAMAARSESFAMDSVAPAPQLLQSALAKNGPGAAPAAGGATDMPVRTKFETAPLFVGRSIVSGSGTFQLPLPDNIGTFSIRAYAVDASSRFGQAEAEVTSTKALTIQPMFPRFVRPGDVFDSGVIVSGDSANYDSQVSVGIAALNSSVSLIGGNSASVRVSGTTPVKVKFPMSAVSVGDSYFRFSSSDTLRGQDSFEDKFNVLATQDPVTIATSMAIQASPNGSKWDEGIMFPAMIPGSGSLDLTAAVGRLPIIETLASVVLNASEKTNPDEDAYSYLSRALLRNVFTRYPNAQGAAETLASQQFPGVVEALRRLTDPRLGLRWSNRSPPNAYTNIDTPLNFYGMYVAFRSYLQRNAADINTMPFRGMKTPVGPPPNSANQNGVNGPMGEVEGSMGRGGMMGGPMNMANPDMMNMPGLLAGNPGPVFAASPPLPSFAGVSAPVLARPGRRLLQLLQQPTLVRPQLPQQPQQLQQPQLLQQQQSSSGNVIPRDIVVQWATALERGIVNEYYDAVRYGSNFSNWDLLAETLTVLGLDWTAPRLQYSPSSGPAVPATANPADVLSLRSLQANVDGLSYAGQVRMALAYVLRGESNPLVGRVVNQTIARILVQGRTAYLKVDQGSNNAAPTTAQAAALELLALTNVNHPFVEKLANYLAQGNVGNVGSFYSFSSQGNALSALAFAVYDQAKQNVNANAILRVTSGNREVLTGNFQSANSRPVSVSINPDTLPFSNRTGAAQPLEFVARGTGEVSVAALINFVPAQISPDPIYRGIYVERTVQRAEGGKGTGPSLQLVKSGDFVVVTIQITSPDDLSGVMIQDLLPGGLEAVDSSLAGGSSPMPPMPLSISRSSRFIYPPWRDPFGSAIVYPDRVTWQADWLRQGTYSVSYTAVAVTTGTFLHPPTKAMSVAQPEVMGLSGGGFLVVSEDLIAQAQQAQYLRARNVAPVEPLRPLDCKTPCPASGYCNLRTGTCQPVVEMRMLSAIAPIASDASGRVSSAVQSAASSTSDAVQSAATNTVAAANTVAGKASTAANTVAGKASTAGGKVAAAAGKAKAKAGKTTARAGKVIRAAVP